MQVQLTRALLRTARLEDAESLARHLDDRAIWRNLRDRMPYPYKLEDAHAYLRHALHERPVSSFVLELAGEVVGGLALHPQDDVHRRSVEIGFWIGRAFQGRGLCSEAVPALTRHAFERDPEIVRVQAQVFGWNAASLRVLEKAGYRLEGTLREAVFKDGTFTDLFVFGMLRREALTGA
ncbi:MAG: GNAT family protein [Planctomycetota bacterium]